MMNEILITLSYGLTSFAILLGALNWILKKEFVTHSHLEAVEARFTKMISMLDARQTESTLLVQKLDITLSNLDKSIHENTLATEKLNDHVGELDKKLAVMESVVSKRK